MESTGLLVRLVIGPLRADGLQSGPKPEAQFEKASCQDQPPTGLMTRLMKEEDQGP